MPLWNEMSTVFSSPISWIIIGIITALGILRGIWKGLIKKKRKGTDYLISLVIYIVTDGFLSFIVGCILCVLLQYLPSLLGLDGGLFDKIIK